MKVLILHLSDFHLRNQTNIASDRLRLVPQAVANVELDPKAVVVAVSGDIAFSGSEAEYAIAKTDLTELLGSLKARFAGADVHFLAVPGNHDCDLGKKVSVREILIEKVRENNEPFDAEVVTQCGSVQAGFQKLVEEMQTPKPHRNEGCAYCEYLVPVGEATVLFRCYNSALTSTNPESAGQLTYPLQLLVESATTPKHDYVVSVFHHPYNWLNPAIARKFKEHVERSSDLILTGHEHEAASYMKYSFSREVNEYLEGAVFQEHGSDNRSGFNAIWVDLLAQKQRLRFYEWDGSLYKPEEKTEGWTGYDRSGIRIKREFHLTDEMDQALDDPGATFQHPGKPDGLKLEDIYIFPNVHEFRLNEKRELMPDTTVEGKDLLKRLTAKGRMIVIGRERSGKSTLARVLFREYYKKGFVPVLVDGGDLTASCVGLTQFEEVVEESLQEQYRDPKLPLFEQVGKEKTVVIIDDFDHAKMNAKGRLKLLDTIHRRYDHICVFADDFIQIEELAYGELGSAVLSEYEQVEIKEFGYFLRTKLIEKWYGIGSEFAANPEDLDRRIHVAENLIDTFLGRSYLPQYPIFILTFLQAIDSAQPINASAGAYGHLWEVFITTALARASQDTNIDTKYTYLAELAHCMFAKGTKELSEAEFVIFHRQYREKYSLVVDRGRLFKGLTEVGILAGGNQEYRFKYLYFYYYFVARYLRDNIQSELIRKEIDELCVKLHKEDHANIWLFLTHFSKDPFLLECILAHAQKLFQEIQPAAFEKDLAFLDGFYELIPKVVLVDKTPQQVRESRRRQLDAQSKEAELEPAESEENEVLKLIAKFNAALRTMEVLGQLVKNFPGSLVSDTKYNLVKECYDLGLRLIEVLLGMWRENGETIVGQIVDLVLERHPEIDTREELTKKVKAFVFCFCEGATFGMIKRISHSVGASTLSETYEKIQQQHPTNAVRLIHTSVKLDTVGFSRKEIVNFHGELGKSLFCQQLLKHLVVQHFYLFHTDYKIKQAICEELGIKFEKLRALEHVSQAQKRIAH